MIPNNSRFVDREILKINHVFKKNDALVAPSPDAIVYLVQEPSVPRGDGKILDISPLLQWGKLVVLMDAGLVASFSPPAALSRVRSKLAAFDHEKDYIAVAGGDNLAVVLVGTVLAEMRAPSFNYLRFERAKNEKGERVLSQGSYRPVIVNLRKQEYITS
jgi:hypothetical protein